MAHVILQSIAYGLLLPTVPFISQQVCLFYKIFISTYYNIDSTNTPFPTFSVSFSNFSFNYDTFWHIYIPVQYILKPSHPSVGMIQVTFLNGYS